MVCRLQVQGVSRAGFLSSLPGVSMTATCSVCPHSHPSVCCRFSFPLFNPRPPTRSCPATVSLFSLDLWVCFVSSGFQIPHLSELIQCLSSCLTSLSMTASRFVHVVTYGTMSLFFYGVVILRCMYVPPSSIHLSTRRWLPHFATVISVAMNTGERMSFLTSLCLLQINPRKWYCRLVRWRYF